ncbi:gamma-glutamyl hydrolase-like [Diadema setosum]|uniref:gamma-glutamyl hydrolase-like n=1 Tax=Diadema setosum TaxID=31175 RepID=UPI003B3B7AAC
MAEFSLPFAVLVIQLFTCPLVMSETARYNTEAQPVTENPIIGILTQESTPVLALFGPTYLSASYVKYIESAGGRVVPILVRQPEEYYVQIFKSVNGILFPGGSATIQGLTSDYAKAASILYHLAVAANKNGDFFPLWGTCLGFEALMILTAQEDILMYNIDAHNISFPVKLSPDYGTSRILSTENTPADIIDTLTTQNSTYNSHKYALTTTNFTKSAILPSFYQVLSTNKDLNGVEFISMVEAYNFPFYGSQWHPEKNSFEFKVNACHTIGCVRLLQYMANFFVEEARKSDHRFSSTKAERRALIYNYKAVNLNRISSTAFEQAYFFTP